MPDDSEGNAEGRGETERASDASCTQCGRPAVISYSGSNLCVEHHLMMQQAAYLQSSMLVSHLNRIERDIDEATGGILGPRQPIDLAPPPFMGDKLTLNHINVSGSNIGNIATGTVQQLDASITVIHGHGDEALASSITRLTQALLESQVLARMPRVISLNNWRFYPPKYLWLQIIGNSELYAVPSLE